MEEGLFDLLGQITTSDNSLLLVGKISWLLFIQGGWVIFLVGFLGWFWVWWHLFMWVRWDRRNREWVLLAIDVPKDNEQTPKAVENIFAHLAGAHGSLTWAEEHLQGASQDWFSLELVSIEGYVQFIIRTTTKFRDLVESAIYGQYPDAEITEIEDYTQGYPSVWPNEHYQMYGTEFYLVEDQAFPIRTYPEFEHQMSQEFKDPMQALMETMNKLGPGEQLWLQILVRPIGNKWKQPAIALAKELAGQGGNGGGDGVVSRVLKELGKFGNSATDQVGGGSGVVLSDEAAATGGQNFTILTGVDRERVDGIARKVKKIGFECKIRSIYIATKERFQKAHGMHALVGAIKQFNTEDLNAIKPDTGLVGIHAHYVFTEWRKNYKRNKIMPLYKSRSFDGRSPFVLNIEELATIWHFPSKSMTAPIRHMVQRTDFKHTPPPSSLPYASEVSASQPVAAPPPPSPQPAEAEETTSSEEKSIPEAGPPPNLPVA